MVDNARRRDGLGGGVADDLVAQAGRALGWFVGHVPGARFARRQLHRVEDLLVTEARKRLEVPVARGPAVELRYAEPLRVAMADLLERSVTDSRAESEEYFFATILRQLVPDEARIVAALAGGSAHAVIDVEARGRTVLANASSVGRTAGVVLPGNVPVYLGRLLRLGLAELGEPDPALSLHYELLLTDETVRAADERARRSGKPRHVRRSVRISELGRRFWAACEPEGGEPRRIGP